MEFINVYNVKNYGAAGNGATDDTNAIRAAVTAAQAAGGGIVYLPNGLYLVSEHGHTLRCIELQNGVSLLGESRTGAVIMLGSAQRESVRAIYVIAGASDLVVGNLTVDGNKDNNSVDEHRANILLDNTLRVRVCDVEMRNATGDGISIWQNSADTEVTHCYIHDNGRLGVALGDAGGQKNVAVRDCRIQGNAGGLHIETSVNCDNILFERCYADATIGNAALQVVGGGDPTKYATNVVARDCQLVGGVQVSSASNILIDGCNVTCSDTAQKPLPPLKVTGAGSNITISNSFIMLAATGTATHAVLLAGNQSGDTLANVNFLDNVVDVQSTTADGVLVQSLISARIERNKIVGKAKVGAAFYGVNINAKLARNIDSVVLRGNYIADFPIGAVAQSGSGSIHINRLDISHNLFESVTPGLMSAAMSLDLDGHHAIQQVTCIGNEALGVSTTFATYPEVPMLIGGNRGGISIFACAGSPNDVIAAVIGSMAMQRDGVTGQTGWIKSSGTGKSGWQKINLT